MSTVVSKVHFRAVTGASPSQWLSTQRVRRAQELLENIEDSIDAIAQAAGIGTTTTLRRHFARTVGVPQGAYRRTFAVPLPQARARRPVGEWIASRRFRPSRAP